MDLTFMLFLKVIKNYEVWFLKQYTMRQCDQN